jgi:hypothetical protein
MKKLMLVLVLLFASAGGAAAAVTVTSAQKAVNWPASCSTNACVNAHLNDLNSRLRALKNNTFSDAVVVTYAYSFDPDNREYIQTVVPCGTPDPNDSRPFKGWAISGGVTIGGSNADQWQVYTSGPPNAMNSWPIMAHNPEYVDGDPLPDVTVFAICLK